MVTIQVRVLSNKKRRYVNRNVNIIVPKGWKKNDIAKVWEDEKVDGLFHWKTKGDLASEQFKNTADVHYGVNEKHVASLRNTYNVEWLKEDKERQKEWNKNRADPEWVERHKEKMAELRAQK